MEINNDTRKGLINNDAKVNIEKEVSELIKKGADKASMKELRRKFGDDKMFGMIQEAYFNKLASIQKRAMKFTKLIEKKYGMLGYPLHVILNKAIKYKKKFHLSEEEFELFRQYYQKSMNMRNNPNKLNILVPNTNMAKVFGDDPYTNNKIYASDKDHIIIKEIIDLYEGSRFLWQQITLQSIIYQGDLPITKFDVDINNNKMINFSSPIHPVVAALFLPKINNFDEYFLFTNLAYILKCKHLGEPLTTYHSYLMLYNLVTDPTDVVCNSDSPLRDILNRGVLQITLWRNVLKLREGNVYDSNNSFVASDFMINIDGCKLSTYDAPDLLMIGDENVIIRRLLNALSFRCATVMSTPALLPIFQHNVTNTMQVNTLNIPFNFTQITKVPMIYIRLPPKIINSAPTNVATVQDSLNTTQTVMSNGKLESRTLTVANTEQLLIISIPRRTYKPIGSGIYNLPQAFTFNTMPYHAIGLEVLNDTPIVTNKYLTIHTSSANRNNTDKRFPDKLFFKSAVVLKEKKDNQNQKFIYGTKTYMVNYHTENKEIRVYNPISDIQKIDRTSSKITMTPLRNLTSTFCNQIVRHHANDIPGAAALVLTEKYVTSLEEEDKIHDFVQRQTILIYTNELKPNSEVQEFIAPNNALRPPNPGSPPTYYIQKHYNDFVNTDYTIDLSTLKKIYVFSIILNITQYLLDTISSGLAGGLAPGGGAAFQSAYADYHAALLAGGAAGIQRAGINAFKTGIINAAKYAVAPAAPPAAGADAEAIANLKLLADDLSPATGINTDNKTVKLLVIIAEYIIQAINAYRAGAANPAFPGDTAELAKANVIANIDVLKHTDIARINTNLLTTIVAIPAIPAGAIGYGYDLSTIINDFDVNISNIVSNLGSFDPNRPYSNFSNADSKILTLKIAGGVALNEGNQGNLQLNDNKQFTLSKYIGDITFIDNTTTYKIEDLTPAPGAAPAPAPAPVQQAIGILKTDIGLVPAHF